MLKAKEAIKSLWRRLWNKPVRIDWGTGSCKVTYSVVANFDNRLDATAFAKAYNETRLVSTANVCSNCYGECPEYGYDIDSANKS
jgi:hypothetical protein